MKSLASIIIPCFNAEKWLRAAIDSCISQTYLNLEIIVIDDGSTDTSLEIVKSYGNKIIWESGPNRGGGYARNRGFTLSTGDYIQYLDADDYLLPKKLERQIHCLEATKADVVYSDWRHQFHLPDGTDFLSDIQFSGPKTDFLEALLLDDRWIPPVALLFAREIVTQCHWDETLRAGQDRDFLILAATKGAKFEYQAGCHAIYRRYGNTTVSTSNRDVWRESHFLLMQKAETNLSQLNQLSSQYRQALAESYFAKIRPARTEIGYPQYLGVLRKIVSLQPEFKPKSTKVYSLVQTTFGFIAAELLVKFLKTFKDRGGDLSTS